MAAITLLVAFASGVISFLSPCILPLIPGYIAFIGGTGIEKDAAKKRGNLVISAIIFVLGFSFVFAALAIAISSASSQFSNNIRTWLSWAGGTLMILFGMSLLGLVELDIGSAGKVPKFVSNLPYGHIRSFAFGAAFAAGWTPCVGAVLGGVIGLAATQPYEAFPLLMAYCIGIGVPFVAAAAFASRFTEFFSAHKKMLEILRPALGLSLVAIGILVFTANTALLGNLGSWALPGN